ncbi:MAG: TIGR02391 family protein [Terriglobales bacterium]
MSKIARKTGKKDITGVNKMVSARAAKLGVSAEAALIIIAKEHNIGTSTYQRRLDVAKQGEVRGALPSLFASARLNVRNGTARASARKAKSSPDTKRSLKVVIEYLIQDHELRDRCEDILLASKNFDRPINQATLVLEDRIRNQAQPAQRLVGENLINYAFKEDLAKTVLSVASNDTDDQRGLTQILRGVVSMLRNKTHHHATDDFSREDAIRVCGFIDVLLRLVDSCKKIG